MQHESEVKLSRGFSAKARQIRSLCMQHESEVKMSRGFSAKARQIRSLCMQHESEVKMSRGADMTTHMTIQTRMFIKFIIVFRFLKPHNVSFNVTAYIRITKNQQNLLVFEKFTRADLSQIALEIMRFPIQIALHVKYWTELTTRRG